MYLTIYSIQYSSLQYYNHKSTTSFYLLHWIITLQQNKQPNKDCLFGGDKGNRTLDPLRARQVLSQLSYIPVWWTFRDSNPGPTGYEPVALTSWAKDPYLPGDNLLFHKVTPAVPSAHWSLTFVFGMETGVTFMP